MIKACDLRKTSIVEIDGTPHCVENIVQQSPTARGGNTLYKVRFRNVTTQQKVDKTYRADDALVEAFYESKLMQFLYASQERYTFMDSDTYDQYELNAEDIEECLPFLLENMEGITALISDGKILTMRMPDTVEMEIVECAPSAKGASVTARTKPATMATGLVVQVPEYIEQGEVIRIDTRDRKYLSRA